MTLRKSPGRISRTLSVLLRAERLIAARRVAILRRQTGLMVMAGLFVGVAVVMLNVAAYLGLSEVMPEAWAALFVALGNLVIAVIMALIAGRMSGEGELGAATEMRDMALEELEIEVDDLVDELRGTARDVRQLARDPLGALLPGALGTLLNLLMSIRGGGEAAEAEAAAAPDGSNKAPPPQPPAMEPDDPDFPEDPAAPQG